MHPSSAASASIHAAWQKRAPLPALGGNGRARRGSSMARPSTSRPTSAQVPTYRHGRGLACSSNPHHQGEGRQWARAVLSWQFRKQDRSSAKLHATELELDGEHTEAVQRPISSLSTPQPLQTSGSLRNASDRHPSIPPALLPSSHPPSPNERPPFLLRAPARQPTHCDKPALFFDTC